MSKEDGHSMTEMQPGGNVSRVIIIMTKVCSLT